MYINMNLVPTGHRDINAKEKIKFDLYISDYGQNNTAYCYLLVLLNTFFLKIRTLLSEMFLKNTNILSMTLSFCITLKKQ